MIQYDSMIGMLTITESGITVSTKIDNIVNYGTKIESKIADQLDRYFSGKDISADIVDLIEIDQKLKPILRNLFLIKKRETISYSSFADTCQNPKAFRYIGSMIGKNPLPIIIPCHRVIKKNGDIGGYIFGQKAKDTLLRFESKTLG